MNFVSTMIFLVVVGIFFILSFVKGQDMIEVSCQGHVIKATKEHMIMMNDCMTTLGAKKLTDLSPKNAGCFAKCIMVKNELIDDMGKPHKDNIMRALDEGLPPALVEPWKKAMEGCLDSKGNEIKVPDDNSCSSYLSLAMCIHMAFFEVCK